MKRARREEEVIEGYEGESKGEAVNHPICSNRARNISSMGKANKDILLLLVIHQLMTSSFMFLILVTCYYTKYVARKKYQVLDDGPYVEAINKFTDMMRATMSDLVRRIGRHDEEISNMIKEVFGALGLLPDLTMEERVIAAEMLVEKPNKLALFFSLPQEARLILVRRLLKSV